MVNVEELINKLESCVISCDNIVTYKWISKEWSIHVNTAKQLLFSFLSKWRSKDEPVNLEVIYFISGILDEGEESNSYHVSLVREKDLEKTKSKFKTIFSEHVYSVQKSSLIDIHDLYIIDKVSGDRVIQGKCGKAAITCKAAIPRNIEAFEKSRLNAVTASENSVKSESSVVKNVQNGAILNDSSSKESPKSKEVKEGAAVNGKIKKDDKKGIAGMFAAQTKNAAKKSESEDTKKENSKTIIQKPKNQKTGIANLFAKQAERPPAKKPKKEEPKKKIEPVKSIVVEEEEDPFASEDEVDVRRELIVDERSKSPIESVNKRKTRKNDKEIKKKKKKPNGMAGEEESPLPSKKRRRIKMMSSSEESSEEETEVGESESPIPDTPKPTSKTGPVSDDDDDDIIPASPTELSTLGVKKRRKKRVMENKTYFDDQGFIVTKKEYVFVSCSEDSNGGVDDAKSKDLKSETKTVDTPSPMEMDEEKKKVASGGADKEEVSPKGKGKKGKVKEETKKNGKKISPQNARQGVLTSFFKRSS